MFRKCFVFDSGGAVSRYGLLDLGHHSAYPDGNLRFALLMLFAAACSDSVGGPSNNPHKDGMPESGSPESGVPAFDSTLNSDGPIDDTVVMSFAFVGGCRVSKSDLDPTNNPSSANLPELQQTLSDLAALPEVPKYWFFVGDLVDGLVSGHTTLQTQLNAWAQIYDATTLPTKLTLVPVVGNHEVLFKKTVSGTSVEVSNTSADAVWISWLASNGFAGHGGNGPTNGPPNQDSLQDDQSSMTYSFDDGANHFIVLDTDTWTTVADSTTGSTQVGWVALNWLQADIQTAQADPQITGIYVFGHKPLISPSGATDGSDAINPMLATTMMQTLDENSKVKGYFTAHSHEWFTSQLPGARGVTQIIAGNGGSSLETTWTEANPYFGFTVVKIYASGKVGAVSYQRPAPSPYNSSTTSPATPAPEIVVAP